MSKIMVDNWFMEEVLASITNKTTYQSKAYAEFLMAIVLWDKICYPKNNYNWWNSIASPVKGRLEEIDDSKEEGLAESVKLLLGDEHSLEDEEWIKWHNIVPNEASIVGTGAVRYILLSHQHNCEYLPCSKRKAFLRENVYSANFYAMLRRFDEMNQLDEAVEDFLRRMDRNISIKIPCLVKYIFDCAIREGVSPVDFAFDLRDRKPVKDYRNYLQQLIQAYRTVNVRKAIELQSEASDAVANVVSLNKKKITVSGELPIFALPKFSFEIASRSASVTASTSGIKVKVRINPHHFNFTFLSELAEHAINDVDIKELLDSHGKIHLP